MSRYINNVGEAPPSSEANSEPEVSITVTLHGAEAMKIRSALWLIKRDDARQMVESDVSPSSVEPLINLLQRAFQTQLPKYYDERDWK